MQTTIFKQKSNYWRVFALCFFTAVLLFAPHASWMPSRAAGTSTTRGTSTTSRSTFTRYANAFVKKRLGRSAGPTDLGSGFDQFLLVATCWAVRSLAVHGRARAAHAVGHGAAALPENGRCGRRRVSLGAPLGAGRDLEHAGGLPVCVFRVQHLQHLFQPLSGRCGAVSVHAGRAGRRGHRRKKRRVPVLGRAEPCR